MIDANQRWDVAEAIGWVSSLAEFKPLWIEEPTSPDDILGHAAISKVRGKFDFPPCSCVGVLKTWTNYETMDPRAQTYPSTLEKDFTSLYGCFVSLWSFCISFLVVFHTCFEGLHPFVVLFLTLCGRFTSL